MGAIQYILGVGLLGLAALLLGAAPAWALDAGSALRADAGADRQVATGQAIFLRADISGFTDSSDLGFAWSVLGEADAMLLDATGPVATLRMGESERAEVELRVTDPAGRTATDTVVLSVDPVAPQADAGADRTIALAAEVVLDAGGTRNSSGLPVDYSWTLSPPDGSTASLSDASALRPSFTPDVEGTYIATLSAKGRFVAGESLDTIMLTTGNTRPVASAGPDRSVTAGDRVVLDPTGTVDADGDALEAVWTLLDRPDGSSAQLAAQDGGRQVFTADMPGDYLVGLSVSDAGGSSDTTVLVSASTDAGAGGNTAPVARAGSDRTLSGVDAVRLDGTGSTDAQGDRLSYAWSVLSAPVSSLAVVADPAAPITNFIPDLPGAYQLQLSVSDARGAVSRDTVVLDMRPVQARPDAGAESAIAERRASVDGLASQSDTQAVYRWSALNLGMAAASVETPDQLLSEVIFEDASGLFDDPKIEAGIDVLRDYNLFVAQDHFAQNHVGGRAAVAGRSKGGWSSYGYQLGDTTGQDVFTVGAGLHGGWRKAHGGGNIRTGGPVRARTYFHSGGHLIRDRHVELWDEVQAVRHLSRALADLPATGDYDWHGDPRHGIIRLLAEPDASGVAVFHFENAASLLDSRAVRQIKLDANDARTIVINVANSHINIRRASLAGDFLDADAAATVIWNFHQARSLHVGQTLRGAVLAPQARTKIVSPVKGSVAVGALHQFAAIKLPTFAGQGLIGDGGAAPDLALLQLSGDNGLGLAPAFDSVLVSTGNLRPVARIAASVDPGQMIEPGTSVLLDADLASDPDGDTLAYRWPIAGLFLPHRRRTLPLAIPRPRAWTSIPRSPEPMSCSLSFRTASSSPRLSPSPSSWTTKSRWPMRARTARDRRARPSPLTAPARATRKANR